MPSFSSIVIFQFCQLLFSTALSQMPSTTQRLHPVSNSSEPIGIVDNNLSAISNLSSYSVLNPTWLENIKRVYAGQVLSEHRYYNAEALVLYSCTEDFRRSNNPDDFQAMYLTLKAGPAHRSFVKFVTGHDSPWGSPWRPGYFEPLFPWDGALWNPLRLRLELDEAFRLLNLAGITGPWGWIYVLSLFGNDPYYRPGQTYYVFVSNAGEYVNAVGTVNRMVIKDFPDPRRQFQENVRQS